MWDAFDYNTIILSITRHPMCMILLIVRCNLPNNESGLKFEENSTERSTDKIVLIGHICIPHTFLWIKKTNGSSDIYTNISLLIIIRRGAMNRFIKFIVS